MASSEYRRKWRKENPEKHRAQQKLYYERHKEKVLSKKQTYYVANREGLLKLKEIYYDKNRKDILRRQNVRRRENPDVRIGYVLDRAKRKTREAKAGGYFTVQEWKALCKKHHYRCLCCGKRKKLTADHVIPVSKGGTSSIDNIQPLCKSCNSKKKDKTIDYRQ
jgi:5-methylcytosine-specific restriction endonuclease McrA